MVFTEEDLTMVESLKEESADFRLLLEEHHHLDKKVAKLDKKRAMTPEDEAELARLKREKLHGKDKIFRMLAMARGE